jgi:oligogalacturonide lyase
VNADETLLLGSYTEGNEPALVSGAPNRGQQPPAGQGQSGQARPQGEWMVQTEMKGPDGKPLTFAEQKEVRLNDRLEQRLPMAIFTISTKTGEMKIVHRATDWLNHLQFSPTDPNLIMFCHEGPWHKVDRIWTIRTDGTGMKLMHARTMEMEIAGHEFWNPDGKMIWFDLQTPRSQQFWIAGVNVETAQPTRYPIDRDYWSVHYNISRDGKLFAGDGGDPGQVAFAKDGQWINLFHPQPDGSLKAERLVNMSKHNYRLEPNVTFSPDNKWIIFRSNMHGPTHVYAVEINKGN